MNSRANYPLVPSDPAAEHIALLQAEADVAAGRVVPHAQVIHWLRSWGSAKEIDAPNVVNISD